MLERGPSFRHTGGSRSALEDAILSPEPEERLAPPEPSKKIGILSEVARAISLANLCFIANWIPILTLGDPSFAYYRTSAPDFGLPLALLADILALSALVFLFLRLQSFSSPAKQRAGLILFLTVSVFALNELRVLVLAEITHSFPQFLWTALFPALAVVSIIAPQRAQRAWSAVLLVTCPLFPVLAVNTAWMYGRSGSSLTSGARAPMLTPAPANRAIWIIFDELDERLAFEARPQRVRMLEFDRLRRESLFASEALPPGPETLFSLPSLITGRKIADVKTNPADLRVRFAGVREWTRWSTQSNVFERARQAGFNTALSGWYHPYCRVIGDDLCDCAWDGFVGAVQGLVVEDFLKTKNFFDKAAYLANWKHMSVSMERSLERQRHIEEQQFISGNAVRMLRNPKLNLVLIHLPIPHRPGIWDAEKQAYTDRSSNYVDNLMLADRMLGDMRRIMERDGDWDRSAVLVSSDHPFRTNVWRRTPLWSSELEQVTGRQRNPYIPFILKLPGRQDGAVYSRKFNTVLSGDLLLDLLNGRLKNASEVSAWLDRHADQSLLEPEGPIRPRQ